MCDETTFQKYDAFVSRRQFAALGAGVAAMATIPGCMAQTTADSGALATTTRDVAITTADGTCDAAFITPREGRHPAVVLWPDIAGLREATRTMGARLAAAGYAVLVVNQYYRGAKAPVLKAFNDWRSDEGMARIMPLYQALTAEGTIRDATAFVNWLDSQPEVDTRRKIGANGYCMGGPFAVRTAFAVPDRVGAVASCHGASLVTADANSPHRLIGQTHAAYLFAIGQDDDESAPTDKVELRKAADAAHRSAEIEVYPAPHGWCTIDAPMYDRAQAEKAWGRMLALFKANL